MASGTPVQSESYARNAARPGSHQEPIIAVQNHLSNKSRGDDISRFVLTRPPMNPSARQTIRPGNRIFVRDQIIRDLNIRDGPLAFGICSVSYIDWGVQFMALWPTREGARRK